MAQQKAYRIANLELGLIKFAVGINAAIDGEESLVSLCLHEGTAHHGQDPSRIKRVDSCPVCLNEDKATFRKSKEVAGEMKMLPPTALTTLAEADAERKKRLELTAHPADEMGGAFPSGKSYYLVPRKGAENDYALMARLVAEKPELAFVAEFSFTGPSSLFQLGVSQGVLTLRQLARPETVRELPDVSGGLVNEAWLVMAKQWADTVCMPYDATRYASRRAEVLAKLLAEAPAVASAAAPGVAGGDLGAALAAALAAMAPRRRRRATKKEGGEEEPLAS